MYYPEMTLAIGEKFLIENPYETEEGPALATFADGLHLIFYTNNIQDDLEIWGTKQLAVCLSEFRDIPFVCLTFPNSPLTMLFTLNVFRIIGDERGPWLRSISTTVHILLVDNQTGQLACIRTIETQLLAKLRHICREQSKMYADAEQVEIEIQRLLNPPVGGNPVTEKRVMERAKLANLIVFQYPTSIPTSDETNNN